VEISSIEKSFQISSVKEKKYQSSMKLKFSFLDSSDCDSEISKEKVEKFDMSDLDKYMVPISLNKCRKCNFSKYPSSNGVHLCGYAGCEILNRFIENTSELYCTQCKILFTVENSIQNGLRCDDCFSLLSSHPLRVHDEVIKLLQAIAYENILQYKNIDWRFVSNFYMN